MEIKIAITGEIRSGKDTVTEYIQDTNWGLNMKKLYFAEGIESIIRTYLPEAYEGNAKPRKHFQEVGQYMREVNVDVWVNYVERKYKYLQSKGITNFICTDLRQFNEYDWLKANGFTIIKVETDSEIRIERMKASGDKFDAQSLVHPVEMKIRSLKYDYLITNNTTLEDLYAQVDNVLDELKGGF